MSRTWRLGAIGLSLAGVLVWSAWAWRFHVLPPDWTGELHRLLVVLGVGEGSRVAEIGAGSGSMAEGVARAIGSTGHLYATEIDDARLAAIARRARSAELSQLEPVRAVERDVALPDGCCEAVYMRNVMHHIGDPAEFARAVARAIKPGGRVVVIDFLPGTFLHLGPAHGLVPARAVEAFAGAGLSLIHRDDHWGGGMFLVALRKDP
jgi:ubiquinone/menaquinone biosynthesis C-methylase UbiE